MSFQDSTTPKTPGTGRGTSISNMLVKLWNSPGGTASSAREDIAAQLQVLQQQQQFLQEQLQATKQEATRTVSETPKEQQIISAVAVKLPDFWPADPALWFARAESMFNMRGIKDQRTKFDHVAFAISNEFATEIRDILMHPPNDQPYDSLKGELIRRLQISEQKRLWQLLTEEELGDRKPSQLLRRIQQLVGTNTLDELVLAAAPHDLSLESLAAMADRVAEATGKSVHTADQASTPTTTSLAALEQMVASLALVVEKLAKQARHGRGRSQHRTRGRSTTPSTCPGVK